MSFPSSFRDRDQAKFFADNDNETTVRVGNGSNSPLYVTPTEDTNSLSIVEYSEINSVPSSVLTDVISYTVPVGKKLLLSNIEVSGNNLAVYEIELNAITKGKQRTWWGKFNALFGYSNYVLTAGQIVKVKVIHSSSMVGTFNATINGILK